MSHPAQVIIVRLSASQPNRLSFTASLTSPMTNPQTALSGTNQIALTASSSAGPAPDPAGLTFEARLQLAASGGSTAHVSSAGSTETHFAVTNATSATLFVAIASSFVSYSSIAGNPSAKNTATLSALGTAPDYSMMKTAHVSAYQQFFNRTEFDFGQNAEAAGLATDVRAAQFDAEGVTDPGFVALNLNFARYMLISSAWGGAQPPNLQVRLHAITEC